MIEYITSTISETILSAIMAIILVLIIRFIRIYKDEKKTIFYVVAVPPKERFDNLSKQLSETFEQIDNLMQETDKDYNNRKKAMDELQLKCKELSNQEKILKNRVSSLKDTPIEVAEYFDQINQQSLTEMEKRNHNRDLKMFIIGIVFTTVINIIISAL